MKPTRLCSDIWSVQRHRGSSHCKCGRNGTVDFTLQHIKTCIIGQHIQFSIYTHTFTDTHTQTHTRTHTYSDTYTTYAHTYIYLYIGTYIYMQAYKAKQRNRISDVFQMLIIIAIVLFLSLFSIRRRSYFLWLFILPPLNGQIYLEQKILKAFLVIDIQGIEPHHAEVINQSAHSFIESSKPFWELCVQVCHNCIHIRVKIPLQLFFLFLADEVHLGKDIHVRKLQSNH
mmetsp:Transcript_19795/g.32453  ORF Transcript_19795/g.32453 Transcript_19795/m.32453 type:complete len:229 (+) Transcript_19795:81-767(+)